MIHLVPQVKKLDVKEGFLEHKALCYGELSCDPRVVKALHKLPFAEDGAAFTLDITGETGEDYVLTVERKTISVTAGGPAGAFYAIQTLRQLFLQGEVPCLVIEDAPEFAYRGFSHDVTRGKVPTLDTLKLLVDRMAYLKLNTLQLYMEHAFAFKECGEELLSRGHLTPDEMRELDAYCHENFIDLAPELATFGHMFEILQQKEYAHLRTLRDYADDPHFWLERMNHHTIDPLNPASFALTKSLIDQYDACFTSKYFNICCDEAFDLGAAYKKEGKDVGRLYADYVKKIIAYVQSKGKTVMMFADMLRWHPEMIPELSEEVYYCNWDYGRNPPEEPIERFAEMGRKQILIPGTSTWNRLCEDVAVAEENIEKTAAFARKYHVFGILNTNWGDWGNPCSLDLAMHGMAVGAAKAWDVDTVLGEGFNAALDTVLYESDEASACLLALNEMHRDINWWGFCTNYITDRFREEKKYDDDFSGKIGEYQEKYLALRDRLMANGWTQDSYRVEMLLAAEGLCVMAELAAKRKGEVFNRVTVTEEWLYRMSEQWLSLNKRSELSRIEDMFVYLDKNL